MSSIISRKAAQALLSGSRETFKSGNTRVEQGVLFLHGNPIARNEGDSVTISDGGWPTMTTKARLNAFPMVNVSEERGVWFLNARPWDGRWARVNKNTGEWSLE